MKKRGLTLLRVSYITGAVLDFINFILFLFPSAFLSLFGRDNVFITSELKVMFNVSASLMFAWTVLLIWGFLKPFERKGLLLITVLPVMAGLIYTTVNSTVIGITTFDKILPLLINQTIIVVLFIVSYFYSEK